MENRSTEMQLSPKQKQYNVLIASIREMQKKVMQHEDEIADLFNQPKDNKNLSQYSSQMQNNINSIVKIEKEIENLEKKKVKLAKNLDPTQMELSDEVQRNSPKNR